MSSSEYQRALDFLFARTTGGVRLGLDRTLALLQALGNPHLKVPCFHVAGTNGKGSTVACIAALLEHRGLSVATYTSPHLIDFRERIVVGGVAIGEDEVVRFIRDNVALIQGLGATFFEATTAMAFDHIARKAPDVAVIETGLGGRLDSTNVVVPEAAIVTSIDMDHMELLGDSMEKIAGEKAGIFKSGRPAVVGWQWPDPLKLLESVAHSRGVSEFIALERAAEIRWTEEMTTGTAFSVDVDGEVVDARVGLIGSHQPSNAMTAWLALRSAGDAYRVPLAELTDALAGVSMPGRFQIVGNIIFDVAHNPHGLGSVMSTIGMLGLPRPITALVGILGDKDWKGMLGVLGGSVDDIIVTTPPTAPRERRWNLDEVVAYADGFRIEHAHIRDKRMAAMMRDYRIRARAIPDFDAALAAAIAAPGTVLITGSFHTVGDAMSRLQVNPLAR